MVVITILQNFQVKTTYYCVKNGHIRAAAGSVLIPVRFIKVKMKTFQSLFNSFFFVKSYAVLKTNIEFYVKQIADCFPFHEKPYFSHQLSFLPKRGIVQK